ncbi:hypothetical protein MKX01_006384 [Papaver californicum]|nr:hypothetical protein MKX01_006384 [Papaver californicum]
MNKLKGIGATLSRPLSFNRATSMSFSSVRDSAECISGKSTISGRIQVTDKDIESEVNLMDLTDEEKNRRFQTFKKKVMNLKHHRTLTIFSDTSREEYSNWLGCKLPRSLSSEFPHEETYKEMERRLFGRVK